MKKVLLLIIMLFLVGCKSEINDETYVSEDNFENELKYALWSAPSGAFAPQYEMGDYDSAIVSLAYESLVTINPYNEYEGVLAKKWTVSEDSKSITFELRNDVRWHDGEKFTAEDVEFSLYFISDSNYIGSKSYIVTPIKGVREYREGALDYIQGVEVIDEYTIKITTEDVYAPIIEHIGALKIFPKHIWEDVDKRDEVSVRKLFSETVGTGPYILESIDLDRRIRMKRNNEYWNGVPNIEYVSFMVTNSDAAKIKMISGELDFMQITTMDPNELKLYEDAGLSIQNVSYNSFQNISLNTENEVLSDVNIRRALAKAIDRQLIVDTLIFGSGNVANTVYKSDHYAYPDEQLISQYNYNPSESARDMIHKANLKYQNGVLYKDNKPIKLKLIYPSGNKARELSAPIIQENLLNIGIDVELEKLEFSELMVRLREGDYDMGLIGTGFKLDPDVSRAFYSSNIGVSNHSRFDNEQLDELLLEGVKHTDSDERSKIYNDVAVLLNSELPVIFLYNWSEGRVLSDRLKGVVCYPYYYFYNVHEWYLEE